MNSRTYEIAKLTQYSETAELVLCNSLHFQDFFFFNMVFPTIAEDVLHHHARRVWTEKLLDRERRTTHQAGGFQGLSF